MELLWLRGSSLRMVTPGKASKIISFVYRKNLLKEFIILFIFTCFLLPGEAYATKGGEADSLMQLIQQSANIEEATQIIDNALKQKEVAMQSEVVTIALLSVVPILIAFGFIIFIFYLRKRESVHLQKQAELKQQVAEIEMKALRAQINPHFVFNCMNAIYKSIGLNEIEKAGGYLIKFATLMRLILENSRSKEVSLSDDLKAMELYVQMEQFRMGRSFTFTITIDETIHKDNVLIPPMILQPFIENSIWHGFHQINYEPELLLNISRENDQLCLLLRDNGQPSVESPIAPELSSAKKSSLGLILTKERVDLLSKTKGGEASVEISDIRNLKDEYAGKQVLIKIPYDDAS